jgi:hypothetical protein
MLAASKPGQGRLALKTPPTSLNDNVLLQLVNILWVGCPTDGPPLKCTGPEFFARPVPIPVLT